MSKHMALKNELKQARGEPDAANKPWEVLDRDNDKDLKSKLVARVGNTEAMRLLTHHFPEGTSRRYLRGQKEICREPITQETLDEMVSRIADGTFSTKHYSMEILRVF